MWLWREWPGAWAADAGIDLVAEEHGGGLWTTQAKVYDCDHAIKKGRHRLLPGRVEPPSLRLPAAYRHPLIGSARRPSGRSMTSASRSAICCARSLSWRGCVRLDPWKRRGSARRQQRAADGNGRRRRGGRAEADSGRRAVASSGRLPDRTQEVAVRVRLAPSGETPARARVLALRGTFHAFPLCLWKRFGSTCGVWVRKRFGSTCGVWVRCDRCIGPWRCSARRLTGANGKSPPAPLL